MTSWMKQNIYAVLFAGFLSFGIYSVISKNPQFLTADIQWALQTENNGDIRYDIVDNQLIVKAGKNFQAVAGISVLISYDMSKLQLKTDKILWYGDVNITNEDGSIQVTVLPSKTDITKNTELFRIELVGTDYSQLVVNDVLVTFTNGSSDGVSVWVEN